MDFQNIVKDFELRFKGLSHDYYDGATIISKIIYKDKLYDRYYQVLEEFRNLKSGLYSDKHIADLFRSKKDKRILCVNIYRSRALGLLSIADSISRLNINNNMTNIQKTAYQLLQDLRHDMLACAKKDLDYSNLIANQQQYELYEKGVEV